MTPALAAPNGPYVGIEGGATLPQSTDLDVILNHTADFNDGYLGGGAGRAWASLSGDKDNAWALQAIAGLRYAVTPNIDAGVKYRYFHTGKLKFNDDFTVNNVPFSTSAKGNYDSHSVLASLVYNFNSRAEAPPPVPAAEPVPLPPPPPETQTCADGSVILATSTCPAPPPPPARPPAATGERG